MRFVPVSQLPAESDPIPAMRREMKLLRIELERLRAMQKFSLARIDCIMNDRDQWQREAERLSDLMAEAPLSTHEDGARPSRRLMTTQTSQSHDRVLSHGAAWLFVSAV